MPAAAAQRAEPEHRAPLLALVERAYLVGKRRPLTDLSAEKQALIRGAYAETDWASEYSVEVLGIYTDRETAIAAAAIPGGYIHELPVNGSLPEETIRYRDHVFPLSDKPNQHDDTECQVLKVPRCELERVAEAAARLRLSAP